MQTNSPLPSAFLAEKQPELKKAIDDFERLKSNKSKYKQVTDMLLARIEAYSLYMPNTPMHNLTEAQIIAEWDKANTVVAELKSIYNAITR